MPEGKQEIDIKYFMKPNAFFPFSQAFNLETKKDIQEVLLYHLDNHSIYFHSVKTSPQNVVPAINM